MQDVKARLEAIRGLRPPADAGTGLDITQVATGGYLDIQGETYLVTSVFRYLDVKWSSFDRRKEEYWVTEIQLLHLLSGRETFLEWEIDDAIEITLTECEVAIRDITSAGAPLTRAALEDIAEEEAGTVTCQGQTFHYEEDDTWAALFFREGWDDGLPVRMYEFSSDSGQYLTIEMWSDDDEKPDREAFLSRPVDLRDIQVLQKEASDAA